MKFAVAFLVILGLLAALCAAILVNALIRSNPPTQAIAKLDPEVDILVAARNLPAVSVVDSSAVKVHKIAKSRIPRNALTDPTQVVGKVLTIPVVEGEVFSKASFATGHAGAYLAAAVPSGKRAISISLPEWSGMAGLLYPGSVVDVLVSFRPESADGKASETIATTLLQGLQVLAIGSQSIASGQYADKEPGALATSGQVNYRMVTLLVSLKQAEIIQLALQHGTISLAMRNPLDAASEPRRMTYSSELANADNRTTRLPDAAIMAALLRLKSAPATQPAPAPVAQRPATPAPPPQWETVILRGTVLEKRTFPMSETHESPLDASAQAPANGAF